MVSAVSRDIREAADHVDTVRLDAGVGPSVTGQFLRS
jgi:hypothetical protein